MYYRIAPAKIIGINYNKNNQTAQLRDSHITFK